MKKRSIAILYQDFFRERDFKRLGLNVLSKYFDLYLIEFSNSDSKENITLSKSKPENQNSDKYEITFIENYRQFYFFISDNSLNYYIDMMDYNFLSFRIRLLLKNRSVLRVKISLGLLPWVSYKINIVKKILNLLKTGNFLSKLSKAFLTRIYIKLEPQVNIFLYSGSKSKSTQPHKAFEIWTHSFDYQNYIKLENVKEFDHLGSYALFIDQYAPSHPDYKFHKNKPPVSKKIYYDSINSFFDFFEKKTSVKVVIAGHPKRVGDTENNWNGRMQIIGKTPELVKQSSLVISHYSTAISHAVIFRKPILLITTDEYWNSYRKHQFLAFSEALNLKIVNTDKFNEFEITNEVFNINEESLIDYEEKYIRSKYSSSNDIWHHFSEKLYDQKLQQ
tara:strand:+ start:2174 stop:3346 length:1173 start_codon:yes stop_codon:yes gene_type:complete